MDTYWFGNQAPVQKKKKKENKKVGTDSKSSKSYANINLFNYYIFKINLNIIYSKFI